MKARILYDAASVIVVGGPAVALLLKGEYLWGLFYFIAVGSLTIKLESKLWNNS